MRYLLYARKSSESDDKQAQSIDDQLHDLRGLAQQRGLEVVAELTEAKSAKSPGGRPVFAELIARLQDGEADAILCWHVNRLFRNPIDFGTVSWMLQTGALREIHTPHQVHRSGDNVLLLSVENGMANQYILDLKKAVRRGLDSKVAKGWYPHKAPEGYLNVNGIIESDPERFALIRKAWELMLTGQYSPPQILDIMTDEWGYTTKRLKKIGGAPFTRTSIYNLFNNIFYTGFFKRGGEIFQGNHPPMVTMEEFFRVQARLRRRHQVRPRTHSFAYTGLMECGHCGCAVIGDIKKNRLKDGQTKTYVYYACSNSKRSCTRRGLNEVDVDRQILNLLQSIAIPPQLQDMGREVIREWKEQEGGLQCEEEATMAREIEDLERKREKLLDLKLGDLLTDAEYLEQKTKIAADLSQKRVQRQLLEEQAVSVWDNLENTLTLAAYGALFFEGGEPMMRALIAKILGTRYILTGKSLAIELNPVFSPLCEMKKASQTGFGSGFGGDLPTSRQVWWNQLDVTRSIILERNSTVPPIMKRV